MNGHRFLALGAALLLVMGVGGTALAADPMTDNDSSTEAADLPTVPAWKFELVDLHRQEVSGTLSKQEATRYNEILRTQGVDANGELTIAPSATGGVAPLAASYTSHSLTVTQRAQQQNNWCGPATAQSIVLAWHNEKSYSTTSKYDGKSLSQSALAGSSYTNAGATGGTDWVDLDMLHALNRWLWGAGVVKYYQTEPDSAAQVKDYVTSDLDLDWMVAADMIEIAGNASKHYNNHPVDKTIKHWTSIYGYQSAGDTLLFQDPVYGSSAISWSDQVNKTFSLTDNKTYTLMSNNGVAQRGFAW